MDESHHSRRTFAATLVGAAAAISLTNPADAQTPPGNNLSLPDEPVEVTVSIVWLPGGGPVAGASVFAHQTNELLGRTGRDGLITLTVRNGSILRLVEPTYGQQQALRLVQGARSANRPIRVAAVGEGWTIN